MENPIESLIFGGLEPKTEAHSAREFLSSFGIVPRRLASGKDLCNRKNPRGEDIFQLFGHKQSKSMGFSMGFYGELW